MNLFDSHDTDRASSMFVNPDRPYDGQNRLQDNGPDYSGRKPNETEWARFKQAAAVQMSFVGAPMIYYGNEAGMWSPDDPSNRMPMVWQDLQPYADEGVGFNREIFDHHRRLIAARAALEPLRTGDYSPVKVDDAAGVIVYARRKGEKIVYVAVNRSAEAREVTFDVAASQSGRSFVDYLNPATAELRDPKADAADARSTVEIKADSPTIAARGATITLPLPAYGTAILAEK
jgi:cyclomaltodextrinase / maltogenic alpha-amylase / neopullulanase